MVQVELDHVANVILLDDINFSAFRCGSRYFLLRRVLQADAGAARAAARRKLARRGALGRLRRPGECEQVAEPGEHDTEGETGAQAPFSFLVRNWDFGMSRRAIVGDGRLETQRSVMQVGPQYCTPQFSSIVHWVFRSHRPRRSRCRDIHHRCVGPTQSTDWSLHPSEEKLLATGYNCARCSTTSKSLGSNSTCWQV